MQQFRGEGGAEDRILALLGERLAEHRLRTDLSQAELAHEAGVSRATIQRLEAGNSTQLSSFVRVLRALKLADRLLDLAPLPPESPLEAVARSKAPKRQRASGRSRQTPAAGEAVDSDWTWGDE